jgi:hypothetical protein
MLRGSVVHGYDFNYDGGSFSDSCMRRMDGGPGVSVLNEAGGRIAFRFHARDVNLVLRSRTGRVVPFRVLVDGEAPGTAHGLDVDEEGRGTLVQPRLYQLVREPGSITDRTFEIAFLDAGVEAYVFTFG